MIIDKFSLGFSSFELSWVSKRILINSSCKVYDFLTHFVVFDDCFLLDDRKIHPQKHERRGSISNDENEMKMMKKSRKTFYSSGFHEWEASTQSIYSFFAAPTADHGWRRTTTQTDNGLSFKEIIT